MKSAPARYRIFTNELSISAPLRYKDVQFLHESGCRKIVTLSGGFVNSDVVIQLKKYKMECIHFPLDLLSSGNDLNDQISRIVDKVHELLKMESKVHLVCGAEMLEAATIVGILRQIESNWRPSSAVGEALDICRFVDAEIVTSLVLEFDLSRWK